jgi:hypothetical protein
MMLAAVIALKAYSVGESQHDHQDIALVRATQCGRSSTNAERWNEADERTDLVEATIVGKDGDVSVVSASYNYIRSARVEFAAFS